MERDAGRGEGQQALLGLRDNPQAGRFTNLVEDLGVVRSLAGFGKPFVNDVRHEVVLEPRGVIGRADVVLHHEVPTKMARVIGSLSGPRLL